MAGPGSGVSRLSKSATNIDISFRPGYSAPSDQGRKIHYALDRTVYMYDYADKDSFEIPLNNISYTDALQINSWHASGSTLKFYYNYDAGPATYSVHTCYIMNEAAPLQMSFYGGWLTKYEGTLILHEA